jgi:hypothetical protein
MQTSAAQETVALVGSFDDEPSPTLLTGYDAALLGLSLQFGSCTRFPIYDYDKCLEIGWEHGLSPSETHASLVAMITRAPDHGAPAILVSPALYRSVVAQTDEDWPNGSEIGFVQFDNLDDAVIGLSIRLGDAPSCLVYDFERCLDIFAGEDMDYEAAAEWMDFNVLGAYVGPTTPVFSSSDSLLYWQDEQDAFSQVSQEEGAA